MLAVLRQPNCVRLWLGGLISAFGSGMLAVALPFYIYQQTGSTLATGGLIVAQVLPSLLLGSVAGVLVDRWDRRLTMLVCDVARAGLLLLLLAAPLIDHLWLLYLVAGLESVISLLFGQASGALLPRLVRQEDLVAANALGQLSGNITRLAAPALGAAVLAVAGLGALVVLDSLSYIASALAIFLIRLAPAPPFALRQAQDERGLPVHTDAARGSQAEHVPAGHPFVLSPSKDEPPRALAFVQTLGREWWAGIRLIRADRVILPLLAAHALAMIGQGVFSLSLTPYLQRTLHGSALDYGWLVSAQGVGGIVGGLLVGHLVRTVQARHLVVMGVTSIGVLLLVAAAVPHLTVTIALFALIGIPVVGWMVSLQTLLQHSTADGYRGRVLGAFGTGNTACLLLGLGLGSILGGLVDPAWSIALSGGLFIGAGAVAFVWLPRRPAPAPSSLQVAVG